jgi:NTE family protein
MMRSAFAALATMIALGCAGCGTRADDYPLAGTTRNEDRRAIDVSADHPFIVLAFSGGGSRAAALAAGVTARLDAVTYETPSGSRRRLSQDIAIVSSVSGGSVYATYLALKGPGAEEARAFQQKVTEFDGIGYITGRLLNPVTWVSLRLEGRTRIDVLQDMLGEFLETDAKLGTLNQPNKPLVLLNASDLVSGQVFTFDPRTLDDLCMNFDETPLTLATTASAAFPIAFTPVLLQNHSYVDPQGCAGRQIPAGDWRNQLRSAGGRYVNLESYRVARYRDSLRGARYSDSKMGDPDSFRRPEYVRLVDGGVVDNLGLTAVRREFFTERSPAFLPQLVTDGKLKQLVIIAVNARSDPVSSLDGSNRRIRIPAFGSAVAGSLVDAASAGAASAFRGFMYNLIADRTVLLNEGVPGAEFEIYPIDIDFDQLPDATQEQRERQNRVKQIGTSWTLEPSDVPLVDSVAGELLWRHPCFIKLVSDLRNVQSTPDPNARPVEGLPCPWPTIARQPGR